MRFIQVFCLIACTALYSCKEKKPLEYFEANKLRFEESKDEILRFSRVNKPKLPAVIEVPVMQAKGGFSNTLVLANDLSLDFVKIKQDTSLYYFIKPEEYFISTSIKHFSYKAKNELSSTQQKRVFIDDNWTYNDRVIDIAD